MTHSKEFQTHIQKLLKCKLCPKMEGGPVHGCIEGSRILSIGQAPGIHEERFGKPFAYTAGKTLFKWFASIGIEEEIFRSTVNMSAVCRCFPGKAKNGDRKPDAKEIENCSRYLDFEIKHNKPELVIPIGKLAIDQLIELKKYKLEEVIGKKFRKNFHGVELDWIPLPHPSGLNVWNHTPIGKKLISQALELIRNHPAIEEEFFEISKKS
ncbi:uracil-DNA glycosylase [Leptospira perolatii]|uniref:Uracil-DNA glycosylase n=1 Tax=Leptospira perolatii TaxID=2023191 RepID=A0A2M9ZSI9_9LEPT|nr:uracil-DNA glycosylase family protein [Leptospira perolatii]PJZ71507.1 uracil-DNA glycosylase [Leptospira perolatii]PJZ75040.1 uracil-DNA glycosylase [Leptospira perolatii]